jgi:hypothetical protein
VVDTLTDKGLICVEFSPIIGNNNDQNKSSQCEDKQQAVERIASNISGDVCQLLCREETPDASFKEKLLTTSLIGSRKFHSEHIQECLFINAMKINSIMEFLWFVEEKHFLRIKTNCKSSKNCTLWDASLHWLAEWSPEPIPSLLVLSCFFRNLLAASSMGMSPQCGSCYLRYSLNCN